MRGMTTLLAVLLTVALVFACVCARAETDGDPALAQEAREAAHKAAGSLGLQTELPASAHKNEPLPSESLSVPFISPDIARLVLWAALAVVVLVILMTIRDNLWSASRSRPLSRAEEEAAPAAMAARMDKAQIEADELARRGDFAEAIHVLLLQSVGELRQRLDVTIATSLTSREILHRVGLSPEGRVGFADIIGRVEISYFGSHQPDEQDYLDCRRSFEALTRSLGRAVSGLGDRP